LAAGSVDSVHPDLHLRNDHGCTPLQKAANQEITMRSSLLAAAAVGAVTAIGIILPGPAQARDYPFCIKGRDYGTPVGDCAFDTYEQCLATASGRPDYCDANPFYAYPERRVYRERRFARPRKLRRRY
jgi:hypothetical protein